MYINIILQYKEHLSKLESEIDALAKEIEEYNIIKSIPGIGEKTLLSMKQKGKMALNLVTEVRESPTDSRTRT